MRARFKRLEDLGPSCCTEVASNVREYEGLVIELLGQPELQTWGCYPSCLLGGHTCMNYLARVPGVPEPIWVSVEHIDIEESEVV
jgi:hypothetical protein